MAKQLFNNFLETALIEKDANERYSIEQEKGVFLVYDKLQDIFVDRFGSVYTEGYLTSQEAKATIKFLNDKNDKR